MEMCPACQNRNDDNRLVKNYDPRSYNQRVAVLTQYPSLLAASLHQQETVVGIEDKQRQETSSQKINYAMFFLLNLNIMVRSREKLGEIILIEL